jgi:hypothetical protein
MATIRLGRYEARQGNLPPVCICCGTAASVYRTKTFVHSPWWVYLGIPFGLLPFFVLACYRIKSARVRVPLCSLHRNLWRWQQPALLSMSAILCVVFGLVPLALADQGRYEGAREGKIAVVAILAIVTGVCLYFAATVSLRYLGIHATAINATSITLTGVAAEFGEALRVAHQLDEGGTPPPARETQS